LNRTQEEQQVADRMFDQLRDDLLKRDLSNTESYDKAILTLSASSLAFSLSGVEYIVTINKSTHFFLLQLGWGLLVASVVLSLLAYLIGNKAIAVQLTNARDYYKNGVEDAFHRKNLFSSFNTLLNHVAGIMLSVAIICVVLFIGINLAPGDNEMSKKSDSKPVILKSANIPNMEAVSTDLGGVSTGRPERPSTNSANIPTMEQAPNTGATSGGGSSEKGSK
jgi:hypothetical protein